MRWYVVALALSVEVQIEKCNTSLSTLNGHPPGLNGHPPVSNTLTVGLRAKVSACAQLSQWDTVSGAGDQLSTAGHALLRRLLGAEAGRSASRTPRRGTRGRGGGMRG